MFRASIWEISSQLRGPPLGAPERLRGFAVGPFISTDSRAPADRFSRLVYAERYLDAASFKLPTFWPNFDWVRQHEAQNHRPQGTKNKRQQCGQTKPPHTQNAEKPTSNAEKRPNRNQPMDTLSSIDWGVSAGTNSTLA